MGWKQDCSLYPDTWDFVYYVPAKYNLDTFKEKMNIHVLDIHGKLDKYAFDFNQAI